jgi:hypothetical protein
MKSHIHLSGLYQNNESVTMLKFAEVFKHPGIVKL